MVQGLQAKGPAQAGVWVESEANVEAGWVDRLLQGRAVIAYARTAEQRSLMLQGSLVMQKVVQNVVRK
jgi:predicted transcriptional regulator of viral defense system